jgi:hypothetical protein
MTLDIILATAHVSFMLTHVLCAFESGTPTISLGIIFYAAIEGFHAFFQIIPKLPMDDHVYHGLLYATVFSSLAMLIKLVPRMLHDLFFIYFLGLLIVLDVYATCSDSGLGQIVVGAMLVWVLIEANFRAPHPLYKRFPEGRTLAVWIIFFGLVLESQTPRGMPSVFIFLMRVMSSYLLMRTSIRWVEWEHLERGNKRMSDKGSFKQF